MLNHDFALKLFDYLYGQVDGYTVSHDARRDLADKNDLLYGELPEETWLQIVERANPKKDGVFVDAGSGTGRIVMMAHLFGDFKKSIGIELLAGLHNKACEIKEIFERDVKSQISDHVANREIEFLCKNIMDHDFHDVDFVFMNHPFKDREAFDLLEQKFLRELKKGTNIVTIIRALKHSAFKQLGSQKYNFSWGESTAYFHEV